MALSLLVVFALATGACDGQKTPSAGGDDKPATPITEKTPLEFVNHNLGESKQIDSNTTIELNFNKNIKSETVNQTNVALQNASGVALANDQYEVKHNSSDKKQINISLLDANLKKTTANFRIQIGALEDEAGNKFEDGGQNTKTIEFKFLQEKTPLKFVNHNLGTAKEIASNETIVLNFSEALKSTSVNQTNVILQNASGVALANNQYEVKQNTTDKKQININLLDANLKKTTANFRIQIGALEDEAGNKFEAGGQNTKTIYFKFLQDITPPKFISSNIFEKSVFNGANKITLAFSEKLQSTSASKISITKGGSNFTDFSATLQSDKKTIEISFTDANELKNISQTYKITIPDTILDLAGNKLANPQVLELSKTIKANDANTIYATPEGAGAKDGKSWTSAKTFNDALTNATSGQRIFVAQGSYYADPNKTDVTKTFILKDGVKIYGGFDPSDMNKARDFKASILEGKLSGSLNTKRILKGENLSEGTTLDGFLIQNALNADNGNSTDYPKNFIKGAALFLNNSSPQLNNLTFSNNKLTGKYTDGGAIYNNKSSPNISNSTFGNNSSGFSGGAISNILDSNPSISNSTFSNNSANDDGGAIYNWGNSSPSISNSSFNNNSAYWGGAISSVDSTLSISNSSFSENSADWGGVIYNVHSNPNIINSNFSKNSAGNGGAISNYYSSPKIYNSILWDNIDKHTGTEATNNIYNRDAKSKPVIKNSILNADSAVTKRSGQNDFKITDLYDFTASDAKFKDNQTPISFNVDAEGKVASASQGLIKDKGDNALYLQVYDKIKGNPANTTTTMPSDEKDLDGKPRLVGSRIDIGPYEIQN